MLKDAKLGQKHIPNRKIKNALANITKIFDNYGVGCQDGQTKLDDLSDEAVKVINKFVDSYQEVSKDNNKDISKELTNFYLEVMRFQTM